jgi:hypothetical protein
LIVNNFVVGIGGMTGGTNGGSPENQLPEELLPGYVALTARDLLS